MYQLRQSTLYNHYIAPPEIFIYTIIKIDFNDFCKPPHTNHINMSNDSLLWMVWTRRRSRWKKRNVIYELPCPRLWHEVYIGETKWTIKKRLTEHRYAVKKGDELNGIAAQVHKYQHAIDWNSARVSATARRYWSRRTLEAIQIYTPIPWIWTVASNSPQFPIPIPISSK